MSRFEMHPFRAIDRNFTPKEKEEINSWSSRAAVSFVLEPFIKSVALKNRLSKHGLLL